MNGLATFWRTDVEVAPPHDPVPEVLARLEVARAEQLPDQAIALTRRLLADPWYGQVIQAAMAEEIAAGVAARLADLR